MKLFVKFTELSVKMLPIVPVFRNNFASFVPDDYTDSSKDPSLTGN